MNVQADGLPTVAALETLESALAGIRAGMDKMHTLNWPSFGRTPTGDSEIYAARVDIWKGIRALEAARLPFNVATVETEPAKTVIIPAVTESKVVRV